MYLKILRFNIYIENYAKSKWKEQKETEAVIIIIIKIIVISISNYINMIRE